VTRRVAEMTLNVVSSWAKTNQPAGVMPRLCLCRVDGCGVDQQDGDVVLNGIHAAAYAALQTFPVFFQDHRLLANRADEDVEQILGNHSGSIVAPNARRNRRIICDRIAFLPRLRVRCPVRCNERQDS